HQLELLGFECAAARHVQSDHVLAASLGDPREAFPERSAHDREQSFPDSGADCRFHQPGGAAGGEDHRAIGVEQLLEASLHPFCERVTRHGAVTDDRPAHRCHHVGIDLDRAGQPEAAGDAHSTGSSAGLSRQARPTLAQGLPSWSTTSAVKSNRPPNSDEPTPYASTGTPSASNSRIFSTVKPPDTTIFTSGKPAWSSASRTFHTS